MSFAAPVFLFGLLALPLALGALALARRRRARYVVRFPALSTLAAVAPRENVLRKALPTALLLLSLAGLVTALARPEATIAVPVQKASVMLVTDTSGSMQAGDVAPTRIAAAQRAAEHFLARVPKSLQVGLVSYSDAPNTLIAPTQDRAEVRTSVASLSADGGTATGDALASALSALGPRPAGRKHPPAAIVLLSDGASMEGEDPNAVAAQAKAAGVPIYTVALGTEDGVVETSGQMVAVPPDPQALAQIASVSGGRTFAVSDAAALDQVYKTLGSQIGTKREHREVSSLFAAFGLLTLTGAGVSALRWRGRLP